MNSAARQRYILGLLEEQGPKTWEELRMFFWSDERMIIMVSMFRLIDSGKIVVRRDAEADVTQYVLAKEAGSS